MRATAVAVFVVILAGCGGPQPGSGMSGEPDPVRLFELADSCAQTVAAVRYDFTTGATGDLEGMIPPFAGTVTAMRGMDGSPPMVSVSFLPDTLPDGQQLPDLSLMTDGDSAWVCDRSAMILTRGSVEAGADDLMDPASYAMMAEFMIPSPFQAEVHADSLAYLGRDTVEGVDCHVILVEYESGVSRAKWFLGVEDNLPRRVERFAMNGGMSGSQVLVVSGLSFPDGLTAEDFRPADTAGMALEDYRSVLETGSQAPDWTLYTPDGREVSLSALLDTVVVLDFWATWCGPCASAMPGMQELHDTYRGSPVRVLGVNVWESGDPAAFMAENGYTYDILLAGDAVAEEYLVSGIPTFYLIDREGRVAWFARGYDPSNEAELASRIDEALQP